MFARLRLVMLVSVWGLSIAGGAGYLAAHAARPGTATPAPASWPESVGIARDPERWTVVLAAHPRCPCTRATAAELTGAITGTEDRASLIVLAYEPDGGRDGQFADTGVIRQLGTLPGARVVADPGGRVAAAFGALTSGHVAVYAPSGEVRFAGGLTPTRAHVGPNTGSVALRSLLAGQDAPAPTAPVFGCPLDNEEHAAGSVDLGGCTITGANACTP